MTENLFLTGEIQVGKSTILRRLLAARPHLSLGGFRTVAGPRAPDGGDSVHIIPAAGGTPLTMENRVIRRGSGRAAEAFPAVFDQVGAPLLEDSRGCGLILMDEVGRLEDGAARFRRAVLACLDGDAPVWGVVRNLPGALTDAVRAHPRTRLVTVTAENRERVLAELLLEFSGRPL